MPAVPTSRKMLLALFDQEDREPMTAAEIAEELGWNRHTVDSIIRYARPSEDKPDREKLLYIAGWKRSTGTKGRWGARYAPGNLPDVREPKRDSSKVRNARYRKKHGLLVKLRDRVDDGVKVDPWITLLNPNYVAPRQNASK